MRQYKSHEQRIAPLDGEAGGSKPREYLQDPRRGTTPARDVTTFGVQGTWRDNAGEDQRTKRRAPNVTGNT